MADLAALQQVDSELDRLQRLAEDLRRRIGDDAALRERRALRAKVAHDLQQHHLTQRMIEGQSATETQEIQRREARLNSPNLRDEHSYRATQAEIEQHTAKLRELEDSLLASMEDVEATEHRLEELDTELASGSAERQRQVASWRDELAQVEAQTATQQQQRALKAKPIPPGALDLYTRLRPQKGGRAVAVVQGNICGACRVALPPTTLAKARPGVAFVTCDHCGRLLYVPR